MDQSLLFPLLILLLVVLVLLAAWTVFRGQPRSSTTGPRGESPFATSTEGMKTCPHCGMGNLWTERRCSSCGSELAG